MILIVKGRPRRTLTPDLEEYARKKFARLSTFLPEPSTVEVVLNDERGPKGGRDKTIHVTVIRPRERNPLHLEESTDDFRASIDLVQERTERMVRKIRDRQRDFHRRVLDQTQRILSSATRQTATIPGWIWKTVRRQLERRGW